MIGMCLKGVFVCTHVCVCASIYLLAYVSARACMPFTVGEPHISYTCKVVFGFMWSLPPVCGDGYLMIRTKEP